MDIIKIEFQNVAKEYNGEYSFKDLKVRGRGFSSLPITYHKLEVPYKDVVIVMKYEFGNSYLATTKMTIINGDENLAFSLKKTSPYILLFAKKRKSLTVISKRKEWKSKIESIVESSGLEDLSMRTQFDPWISFDSSNSGLVIKTKYFLGFKETETSISRVLNFYIELYKLIKSNSF